MKTNVVFLLLVLAAGQTPKAAAQSPGTFTATGSMTTPRISHTATLLADGRVLITGGVASEFKDQSSAELYDPRTGRFTATSNMTTPRSRHTATLLPDGRVLIAGGELTQNGALGNRSLTSAELYDPGTGTFSTTGEMRTIRLGPTSTLLNNGKVLFVSWCFRGTGFNCILFDAELYDPDTGTFAATGNRNFEGADTATLLPNGKVLFTKGNDEVPPYASSAELYDPLTGVFNFAGYAATNHSSGATATLLMNGKVLIAGGNDAGLSSSIAEHYDPATGAFSKTGYMTIAREQHTATLLPDGRVLFAGGHIDLAATAEVHDPINETFTKTANMSYPRGFHTATLLNDGRVLLTGGYTGGSSAELYTPQVMVPAPLLLSLSGDGRGQGAILHANTPQLASSANPAAAGEALEIYLTGLGNGSLIPPQVSIGGRMAEVLWFGSAPGYAGLNQINVRVPAGISPGPTVPVRINLIGRPSNEVTIGVRVSPEVALSPGSLNGQIGRAHV